MMLRGSTVLPWLFFGPLLAMVAVKVLYDVTGWDWARIVAQVLLVVVSLVLVAGAMPSLVWFWRRYGKRTKNTSDKVDNGPPFP
jgi:membrane protein YdbS with pleckstrin-like domain